MAPLSNEDSFESILAALDASSALGRQQNAIRAATGPKVPMMHHREDPPWRPLPKLDEMRHVLKANASTPFVRFTCNSGEAYHEPVFVRGKVLDEWTRVKMGVPDRSFAQHLNHKFPPRFPSRTEAFGEPTEDMLDESHRGWLQTHYKQRDKHLHPIAHALEKVEKAKKVYEAHQQLKDQTRDLLTRPAHLQFGAPKLGENAKKGLEKARHFAHTQAAMNQLLKIDVQKEREKVDEIKLIKAKSAPELRYSEPPPASSVQHLRRFQNTNQGLATGSFRHTTPWQHCDEVQDLKKKGRLKKLRHTW